jgi:hypothetical protein
LVNIQSIFKPLENVEKDLAHLYRWFSGMFDTMPHARTLFYRMSLDEKSHLALVQYQKRLVRSNPNLFKDVKVDLQEVLDLSKDVNALISSQQILSLERAVALALQFETTSAESHYKVAILDARPEMAGLLWNLELADKQHVAGLKEFAARNGFAYLL